MLQVVHTVYYLQGLTPLQVINRHVHLHQINPFICVKNSLQVVHTVYYLQGLTPLQVINRHVHLHQINPFICVKNSRYCLFVGMQWRIQDFIRGVPTLRWGAPGYKFIKIFPKTAWNQEKFRRGGGGGGKRIPWIRHWNVSVLKALFTRTDIQPDKQPDKKWVSWLLMRVFTRSNIAPIFGPIIGQNGLVPHF